LFYRLLIHTFTKPKNVVTTISFSTSAEAADSKEVSVLTKSGRNDDTEVAREGVVSKESILLKNQDF
jgi:hypothetical protein